MVATRDPGVEIRGSTFLVHFVNLISNCWEDSLLKNSKEATLNILYPFTEAFQMRTWACLISTWEDVLKDKKNVRKISQDDSHKKVKKSSWWLSQKARKNSQWLSQNVRKRARDDNHLNSLVSHPFVALVHFLPQPCLSKYVSFNDIIPHITSGQFHTLQIFYFTHMYLARALLDETLPIRVLAP